MKERYEVWVEKMTKKELAIVEAAEKRAKERLVSLSYDMRKISKSIESKGVTLKSLEGSKVTLSNCILSNFPNAYKHIASGTLVTYEIRGGRPCVVNAERWHTDNRGIIWDFTDKAKEAILKAAMNS